MFTPPDRFEPGNVQFACSKEVNMDSTYECAQSTAKYQLFNFETEYMTLQFDIAKHHCREDYDAVNDKHFYNLMIELFTS